MHRGLGHIDQEFTQEVLGLTINMDKDDKNILTSNSQEGGKTPNVTSRGG